MNHLKHRKRSKCSREIPSPRYEESIVIDANEDSNETQLISTDTSPLGYDEVRFAYDQNGTVAK